MVPLVPKVEKTLHELAANSGRTTDEYIRDLIRDHLKDAEVYRDAVAVSKRVSSGEETTGTLDEMSESWSGRSRSRNAPSEHSPRSIEPRR